MKNYNADKEDQGPKAVGNKKRGFSGVSVQNVSTVAGNQDEDDLEDEEDQSMEVGQTIAAKEVNQASKRLREEGQSQDEIIDLKGK